MFREVESQLGNTMKSHNSMIFDELLKTVISPENDPPSYHHHDSNSSFLFESTSDSLNNNEIWGEISKQKHAKDNNVDHVIGNESNLAMAALPSQHWLPLELQIPVSVPMQMSSIHVEKQPDHLHQNQQQIPTLCPNFNAAQSVYEVYENKPMEIDYSEKSLDMSMPLSSPCLDSNEVAVGAAVGVGVGVETIEKTVERKQKRMAKNRESAAKSRAKKQVTKSPPLLISY